MALSRKDKQGVVLMAVAVIIVATLFGFKLAKGNVERPGPDGCTGVPEANTVIVLDQSETISDQTKSEISARVLAYVRDHAAVNERVTVFAISDISRNSLTPTFNRCKVRQDGNRIVENTKGLKKGFERDFLAPLEAALAKPTTNGKESPIAEAIIDLSLSQFLRGQRNSLLLFSDLMEHMPAPKFSLYSCADSSTVVNRFLDSRRGAQQRPKFTNTSVFLHVIPRTDLSKSSLQCRDKLWPWFFGDSSGADAQVHIDYLPGA